MKRQTIPLPLAGLVLFTMAGCTVTTSQPPSYEPAPVAEAPPAYVEQAPPPERTEVLPAAPGPGYVQQRGHWRWDGSRWDWVSGRWEPERAGRHWVEGHWEHHGRGHVWREGYWQ